MKSFSLSALLYLLIASYCNAQSWNWTNQIRINSNSNTIQSEYAYGCSDGQNIYVIGEYGGALEGLTDTINSSGPNDLFVMKYDQNGIEQWVKGFGGSYYYWMDYERINGYYHNNSLFVGGSYINPTLLDTILLPSHSFDSADIFLARMDLNGQFIWARHFGSAGTEFCRISLKPNGNPFMVGGVRFATMIDTFQINPGMFVAEFDQNGNCIWAENKLNLGNGLGRELVYFNFIGSDIILAGSFNVVGGTIDTAVISSNGDYDSFICRLDSDGDLIWLNTFGGQGLERITDIELYNNEIYVSLYFTDSFQLDANNHITTTSPSTLLLKYSDNGNLVWNVDMKNTGTIGVATAIEFANDGTLYMTGVYTGSAIFGNDTLVSVLNRNMFLARYNPIGDCLGVIEFGEGQGDDVVFDSNNNTYSIGYFNNIVSFGSNTFTSIGPRDLYVGRLSGTVGIGENFKLNNQLSIYANPNAGIFEVSLPDGLNLYEPLKIDIYNSIGEKVFQNVVNYSNLLTIDVDQLPTGVYNLILSQRRNNFSGKIIIQN